MADIAIVGPGAVGGVIAASLASIGRQLTVTPTDDFRSAIWRKLCVNSAGAINALLLEPAGVFHDEAIGRRAVAMARECLEVGRAEGARLEDDLPEAVLEGYRQAPRDSVNSSQADRAAGRPMEVDARNGAVVRFGRRHGVQTPLNEMALTLLGAMRSPARDRDV